LLNSKQHVSFGSHVFSHLKELIGLGVATLGAITVLFLPIFEQQEGAKRCLALVVFVAVCWSTTALPPFVTAFTIPFLAVTMSILPFPATSAATTISMAFFDPVILLFLGGLTFAAALDKYKLNQRLALLILRLAGDKPIWNLAALMGLCYFLSMWVTNVAASVVGVSIAKPIIDKLHKSDPYAKVGFFFFFLVFFFDVLLGHVAWYLYCL
jgi:di/tricarboxylate transporter